MYALYDANANNIVQGPWAKIPSKLNLNGLITITVPAQLDEDDNVIRPEKIHTLLSVHNPGRNFVKDHLSVVEVIDTDRAPSTYFTQSAEYGTLVSGKWTISRVFTQTRVVKVHEVRGQAEAIITDAYPVTAQINMLHRRIDLTTKGAPLTPKEQDELVDIETSVAWIRSVRTRSNDIEKTSPMIDPDFRNPEFWVV